MRAKSIVLQLNGQTDNRSWARESHVTDAVAMETASGALGSLRVSPRRSTDFGLQYRESSAFRDRVKMYLLDLRSEISLILAILSWIEGTGWCRMVKYS